MALDADHDGELSAAEIDNAPAALRKLDRNRDGKLTREELRPPRDAQGRGEGPPGRRDRPPGALIERLMQMDQDGDGKVSRKEAPENMQNFDRFDANGDGFIERSEAEKVAERIRNRLGPPEGRPERRPPPREEN